jgi:inosine/xanthosine triphosphate pyrophosphatase family protein
MGLAGKDKILRLMFLHVYKRSERTDQQARFLFSSCVYAKTDDSSDGVLVFRDDLSMCINMALNEMPGKYQRRLFAEVPELLPVIDRLG